MVEIRSSKHPFGLQISVIHHRISGSHLMNFIDRVHWDPVDLVHGSVDPVHTFFFRKIISKAIENP
jgi:hypothetical protein